LLFVSDAIPAELRQTVEFLNSQMDPAEVLAVEIKQYAGEGSAVLVPRVYGQTEAAKAKKSGGGDYVPIKWNEELFFEDLGKKCPAGIDAARRILEWAKAGGHLIKYGSGAYTGSFVPWVAARGLYHFPILVLSDGTAGIGFDYMRSKPVFDDEARRKELLDRLNAIDGIDIPESKLGGEPYVALSLLSDPERMGLLLATLDWFVDQVRKPEGGEPTVD
jgi:hypothetical protein